MLGFNVSRHFGTKPKKKERLRERAQEGTEIELFPYLSYYPINMNYS